jgi:prevent-host-death family protein
VEDDMVTEVSTVEFRQNAGELLSQVQDGKNSVIISTEGQRVAALVDATLFARIQRMDERFEAALKRLQDAFKDVPEEEGMAMIAAKRHR